VSFATVSPKLSLVDRIENLLPQTQCTKCGYAGCRPYAQAIADGEASYDQCPPGGAEGVARLAALLGRPVIALNAAEHGPERPRPVARIDESVCIGCTLCIQACPVDAIAGAAKRMHTVIESLCTGCDLCVAPCPVDCIEMVPVTGEATGWDAWTQAQADAARARHDHRLERQRQEREDAERRAALRHAAHRAQAGAAAGTGTGTGTGTGAGAGAGAGAAAAAAAALDAGVGKPATGQATVEGSRGDIGQAAVAATALNTVPPAAGSGPQDGLQIDLTASQPAALPPALSPDERKRAIIQAALERARAKKAELAGHGIAPKNTVAVSAAVQAQIDEADARRRRLGVDVHPDTQADVRSEPEPTANLTAKPIANPIANPITNPDTNPDTPPSAKPAAQPEVDPNTRPGASPDPYRSPRTDSNPNAKS
jgi:electron transport complex protein RnfB